VLVARWSGRPKAFDRHVPLDTARRAAVLGEAARLAEGGLRTLALAYRRSGAASGDDEVESDLILIGVVA